MIPPIDLRETTAADLPAFFEHQQDPVACQMAAFPPREREPFTAHWEKILANPTVTTRTVVSEGQIAGNVICYEESGRLLIGYWFGRPFWGQGIASRAVSAFLSLIPTRPLYAYVAAHNLASIRVLQRCGFQPSPAAVAGDEPVDELLYSLLS